MQIEGGGGQILVGAILEWGKSAGKREGRPRIIKGGGKLFHGGNDGRGTEIDREKLLGSRRIHVWGELMSGLGGNQCLGEGERGKSWTGENN